MLGHFATKFFELVGDWFSHVVQLPVVVAVEEPFVDLICGDIFAEIFLCVGCCVFLGLWL